MAVVSGSSNKYDAALGHDIDFVERRARCLPLIAKVIRGEIKARCFRVSKRRGKKLSVRRVLAVIEAEHAYYVMVMAEVQNHYAILTAFPSNKTYYDHCIRGQGAYAGIWGV